MECPFLPVQGAARVPGKGVHRMVGIGGVKAVHDQLARIGAIVAVGVLEEHQVRHLRDVNAPVAQLDADGHVQAVGKNRAAIGLAVFVGVLEDQDLVVGLGTRQIHRIRGHGGDPEPALGVEGHRDRVFQVGKLDLRGKQIDRVALRKREDSDFLVRAS